MSLFSQIISVFTTKKCYACGQVGHFFCDNCRQKIEIYKPYCYVCKKSSENFHVHEKCQQGFPLQQLMVLTRYRQNSIKKALKHAKYYGKYRVYEDIIDVAGYHVRKEKGSFQGGILIPVPMYFLRKWKRGYNQSQKIAEVFSKLCNLSIDARLIGRIRTTTQQSHLSQSDRLKNLTGAFKVYSHNYPLDTPLYLVDDVISTGATIAEIANCLQEAGFNNIRAIIIASD